MKINKFIDHTLLAQDADEKKIDKLIAEAKEHDFASVCVNTCWTKKCAEALKDTDVNVCVVVGFPLGAMDTKSKAFEAKTAVEDGADEIDMVINVGWLKSGRYSDVENDIREVKKACGDKHLKVIIECCLLTDPTEVALHLLHVVVEIFANVSCSNIHCVQCAQQRSLVVKSLTSVRDEYGWDAKCVVDDEYG